MIMDKKMSRKRKIRRIPTDEEKCEVISNAISNIISTSENTDFVDNCRRIIQAKSKHSIKVKLKSIFMNAITKKKCTKEGTSEQCDSFDSSSKDPDDSLSTDLAELEGFDNWEDI